MRPLIPLLVLLSLSCSASAKSKIGGGDGGSLRPLPGQKPAVRMVREKVRITYSETGNYAVLIDYLFRNEGPSCNVAMGLPENDMFTMNDLLSNSDRGLTSPRISVDGRRVPVERKIISREWTARPDYNALSVTRVPFRQRQTRHVRVRYCSRMWGSCGQFMTYLFAGNRWKGVASQTSVTIVNGGNIYYDKKGDPGVTSPTMPLRERGHRSHFQWNNWYPEGAFLVG